MQHITRYITEKRRLTRYLLTVAITLAALAGIARAQGGTWEQALDECSDGYKVLGALSNSFDPESGEWSEGTDEQVIMLSEQDRGLISLCYQDAAFWDEESMGPKYPEPVCGRYPSISLSCRDSAGERISCDDENRAKAVVKSQYGCDDAPFAVDFHWRVILVSQEAPVSPVATPENAPPTAAITYSPKNPSPGDTVTFTSESSDPDGDPLQLLWYINGQRAGTDATVDTTAPGWGESIEVLLVVRDDRGDSDEASISLSIEQAEQKETPEQEEEERKEEPPTTTTTGDGNAWGIIFTAVTAVLGIIFGLGGHLLSRDSAGTPDRDSMVSPRVPRPIRGPRLPQMAPRKAAPAPRPEHPATPPSRKPPAPRRVAAEPVEMEPPTEMPEEIPEKTPVAPPPATARKRPRLLTGGEVYEMPSEGTVTIGRREDNDVILSTPMASYRHAEITVEGDDYVLHDLNSTNGTIVNGDEISEHALKGNDEIQIGDALLIFEM